MYRFYRTPAMSKAATDQHTKLARQVLYLEEGFSFTTETCYYIGTSAALTDHESTILHWLLRETFAPRESAGTSFLQKECPTIIEIGPRLNFDTPFSSCAVAICHACGLTKVTRLEKSRRFGTKAKLPPPMVDKLLPLFHDRMTEMAYPEPLTTFDTGLKPEPMRTIPVLTQGEQALQDFNKQRGCGWDDQDIRRLLDLYQNRLQRDPTNVELFQDAQSNSDHSRHWYYKSRQIIDGVTMPYTLMDLIKTPWRTYPGRSLVAFDDDSSVSEGRQVRALVPTNPGHPCSLTEKWVTLHPTLTQETHNHPTGHDEYDGAATGSGGRIRDNQAVRRGGHVIASLAAYCTANLCLPGYNLPWERDSWPSPANMVRASKILTGASDGASNYQNCFGEPLIGGFVRTYDQGPKEDRRSWHKPIMLSGGGGLIDGRHLDKIEPAPGMLIILVGGPAFRIGVGGGSASAMISGSNKAELDWKSVQRGDPFMEQLLNRFVRGCIEKGLANPIVAICDLGAGGACNALTEISYPAGAIMQLRDIPSGDQSLSEEEIWSCEAQERDAFLIHPDSLELVQDLAAIEGVSCVDVGKITGNGQLVLEDSQYGTRPVDLPLEDILGKLPQKEFQLTRIKPDLKPLELPPNLTVRQALDRVLRMPSIASKRYLVEKADRSVTGRVAQQQCVGPNHTPLSNYAAITAGYSDPHGVAYSIGEQPLIGLIDPRAMARMAEAEALLNLAGACITDLSDIKFSANWMSAARQPGEGARLYDATESMRDICLAHKVGPDGGKDSSSMATYMAAPDGDFVTVKAPMELVMSAYVEMPDVSCKVTPELKRGGNALVHIDLGAGHHRLGSSELAHAYEQIGDECPDLEDPALLERVFRTVQDLIKEKLICSLHDVSSGGLITTLLEMAFAGNLGLNISLNSPHSAISVFFSEELGLVVETSQLATLNSRLHQADIPFTKLGWINATPHVCVLHNTRTVLDEPMIDLRQIWEATSIALEHAQNTNPKCVDQAAETYHVQLNPPPYHLSFSPTPTDLTLIEKPQPKVAILRDVGSNGDREMAEFFRKAGFDTWDVNINHLLKGQITLDQFRGIAFPGGFTYADALGAGKGQAGVIRFNSKLREQFEAFYQRQDTFSLGVCNGCQLMTLMGWVPWNNTPDESQPRFIENESGKFECDFPTVEIAPSPAIMLREMVGSRLGVWIAHGEGRLHVPDPNMLDEIVDKNLAPMHYVDRAGAATELYPYNRNGSPRGITALCNEDGRHLAVMPHPERTFALYQWDWLPQDWHDLPTSPWTKMTQNAYDWCLENAS